MITAEGPDQQAQGENRGRVAFLWDLDKPLILSTYGPNERARLIGDHRTIVLENALNHSYPTIRVQRALAVTYPSRSEVIIENLYVSEWELGGIWMFRTAHVTIQNNVFDRIGTRYFPEEQYILEPAGHLIYTGGVIYPKNSTDIAILRNSIQNCHNRRDDDLLIGDLHVFYISRASNVRIEDNDIAGTSGPPVKLKHNCRAVNVTGNRFLYAAPSIVSDRQVVQQGFIRIPCKDLVNDCPSDTTIADNTFYYPYCWTSGAACHAERAVPYSGQYFEGYSFADRCSDRCWLASTPTDGPYCREMCRGIQLLGNEFRLEYRESR